MQTEITAEFLKQQGWSQTFPERFWRKVHKTDSCWIWIASKDRHGYGRIGRGVRRAGNIKAHRASWVLAFGSIPDGKDVLHNCPNGDNPSCVNPAHLWIGEAKDNSEDALKKGWRPTYATMNVSGTNHPRANLSDNQIRTIRRRYAQGAITMKALASVYGTTRANIGYIVRRKAWSHIH